MKITVLAALWALAGCMAKHPAPTARLDGYVTAGDSALWPERTIPVCWESPAAADANGRQLAQDAVTAAYSQDPLGFQFTGWGACDPGSRGVRIAVLDEVPRVAGYGAWLDGLASGVILNFAFADAGAAACRGAAVKDACIRDYAIHEFGHVLGLRHEANRPDGRCPAQDQTGGLGEAGAFPVGDYDPDSVMNYCRLNADLEQGLQTKLSAGDVSTLVQYYGHALAFPTADLGAQCGAGGGAWNSVDNCCTLGALWTPGDATGYRTCSLPAAGLQQQACAYSSGKWDAEAVCCRSDAPGSALRRWNTFYRRCL